MIIKSNEEKYKQYTMVLCEGRHEINVPHDGYIFPQQVENPLDFVALYQQVAKKIPQDCIYLDLVVTGLTPCVLAVVNYCSDEIIDLDCLHYDRETGEYVRQVVLR